MAGVNVKESAEALSGVVPQPRQPHDGYQVEPIDDSGQAITSYAGEMARSRFVEAMTARWAGSTVTVYLAIRRSQAKPSRLKRLKMTLPARVRLLTYTTARDADPRTTRDEAAPDIEDHLAWWEAFSAGLDGLIVHGDRSHGKGRTFRVGPFARVEMVTMIKLGRPVLLDSHEYGLVPVIDCAPRRYDPPHKLPRLALRVPPAWDPTASTLAAAMRALTPRCSQDC